MKILPKKIFIFIIIIIFFMAFSSSYTALSIDNIETVVAIGLDVSDYNKLKISFQFTNSSSVSESGTSEQSPSIIYSIDASSVSSGINLMNAYIGKELSLSHCKLIAISEELAYQGISEKIYTLINDAQVRPSANIVITKCNARLYMENSKPLFENLLTKYYEIFSNSSKYTGFSVNATIGDFFNSLVCKSCEPYAILGGLNSEPNNIDTSINAQKDYSGKANNSNIEGELGSENMGLAVFNDDKLAGELNSIETLCFLATKNQIDGFLLSIPSTDQNKGYTDIYLTPTANTSSKVEIINGTPYITIKYRFSGRIYSIDSDSKYLSNDVLNDISDSCNTYLESIFSDYLYQTSKFLKSDINGFGKDAKKLFLTDDEYNEYNWENNYKNAFFKVEVDSSIRSSLLLTET